MSEYVKYTGYEEGVKDGKFFQRGEIQTVTLPEPFYQDERSTLYCGDALEVMRFLPDDSIDLIAVDPPYNKVKNIDWDRQWESDERFLHWIGELCREWKRLLKPNGSFYCFASPEMTTRVDVKVREFFNVLNVIRWKKEAGWHNKADKESLRCFLSSYESIIFADHFNSDNSAKGEAGYEAKCDELRGFVFEPLRLYLSSEWQRASLKYEQANEACGTASMAGRHFFSRSQWCLPTQEHYLALREYANKNNHGGSYLRREYEDLRREYEDLRRPFNLNPSIPFTDTWDFPTVQAFKGKHICEKPLSMMKHIVSVSSREGATVLDCFAGSGTTGKAAIDLGRNFIGIERDKKECHKAARRLAQGILKFA